MRLNNVKKDSVDKPSCSDFVQYKRRQHINSGIDNSYKRKKIAADFSGMGISMDALIKKQDAIDVVARDYQNESDRMAALQELPTVDIEREIVLNCDGCANNNTSECLHCMRAYSDCYSSNSQVNYDAPVSDPIYAGNTQALYELIKTAQDLLEEQSIGE